MQSAAELKLEIDWSFNLIGHGSTLSPLPGTIAVDVGNKLVEGIIDTHQKPSANYKSSAHALFENQHLALNHLLGPINATIQSGVEINKGKLPFTFVTHIDPDWDSVSTYSLCHHLIEEGKLPRWSQQLLEATNLIDQGKSKIEDDVNRAFVIYYEILAKNYPLYLEENRKSLFKEAREFIEKIGVAWDKDKSKFKGVTNPFLDPLPDIPEFDPYKKAVEELERDRTSYEQDREKHSETFDLTIPVKPKGEGEREGYEKVSALAFTEPTACRLHKYWAREKGEEQVLLVPSKINDSKSINQWIISVDPNSAYHLPRLGRELEKLETEERKGTKSERGGEPRWYDKEYSNNSDPWYDGRDHNHTIVDSPKTGTVLDYQKIKSALQGKFYGIRPRHEGKRKPLLVTYHFMEVGKHFENSNYFKRVFHGRTDKPLAELSNSFMFIKELELYCQKVNSSDSSTCKLYGSDVTGHAVLAIESDDFPDDAILEEMPERITKLEKKSQEIAREVAKENQLEQKLWGKQSYSLLILPELDFKELEKDKVSYLFGEICRDSVRPDEVESIRNSTGLHDVIRVTASICIAKPGTEKYNEDRKAVALYTLFVKTGYRRFSQIFAELAPKKHDDDDDTKERLKTILKVQRDFSEFLGKYDFPGTEVSLDGKLSGFFNKVSEKIGLIDQQAEIRDEIQLIGNLASSLDNKARQEENEIQQKSRDDERNQRQKEQDKLREEQTKLRGFIIILAILSLGDFLYAFFTDLFPLESPAPNAMSLRWERLASTLLLIAVPLVVLYFIQKRRKAKKKSAKEKTTTL